MGQAIARWFTPDDWKRSIALVILWAYAYNLIVYPTAYYVVMLLNYVFGLQVPGPILVPWEQLLAGTTTLATVGGIQAWRERTGNTSEPIAAGGTD